MGRMAASTMHVTMALVVAALQLSGADAWTNRWDLSKRFNAVGHPEMECDGQTRAASCCLCQSIVHEIETQLDNTEDDYELDVVFRISEEKKKIKYSRSEARILEVLDTVCERVPLELPEPTKKKQKLLAHACNSFVGEYEDELTRTFFNNNAPAKHRMCSNTINVCQAGEAREEL